MSRVIILVFTIVTNIAYADSAEYKAKVENAISDLNSNPTHFLSEYTEKPAEEAINKDNIEELARQKAASDENAILIRRNFNNRPEYKLSIEELSRPTNIINNSNDIVDGISNSYTDCKSINNCVVKYDGDTEYCSATSEPHKLSCDKDRIVSVIYPKLVKKKIRVEMTATNDDHQYTYDLKNRVFTRADTAVTSISQDESFDGITCSNFSYRVIATGFVSGTWTRRVNFGAYFSGGCNNPRVHFAFEQRKSKKYGWRLKGGYIELEFMSQEPPEVHDGYESTCTEVNKWTKSGYCNEIKTKCVDGKSTKKINGIEVTRDCWKYRSTYNCGVPKDKSVNTCSNLEANKCVQISSACTKYLGDKCIKQKKGFKCPSNHCPDNSNMVCGGTEIQCKDGSCVETVPKESSDFNDAITKFSVLSEALKDAPGLFDENTKFMFKGRAMECRKVGYGFSDCCKDKGWGNDMGLAHCSDEEKELGEKKEKLFAIEIGSKTHKNDLGIKKTDMVYCVFDSKLARLIQQYGRLSQLGISIGDPKNPNCSGISPNEFAKIDFDKIDLSEAFVDATSKYQNINLNDVNNRLYSKVKDYYTDEVDENA